jgi:hypothetical protein
MTGQATVPPPAPAETARSEETPTGRLARLARLQALQIIIVLAVIVVVFSVLKPSAFLTVFNIRGIVQNTAILAVLGVGMTFVIITGGIDLSVGSVLVFSGVVADKAMAALSGQGWGAALVGALVAIGCGLAWGLVNGFLIARAKVPPLIVTLGTLGMALGLAEVITGGVDLRDVPTVMVNSIGFGNIVWQIPDLAVIAAVIVVVGIVILHRTRFGLHTFAIGWPALRPERQHSPDQGLRPVRSAGRLRRLAQPGVLPVDHDRRPEFDQPQRDRRRGDRRHQLVRRLRVHLRQRHRLVHPGHAAERLRDHRHPAVLAAGRGRHRADRRRLRRPAAAHRRRARQHRQADHEQPAFSPDHQ